MMWSLQEKRETENCEVAGRPDGGAGRVDVSLELYRKPVGTRAGLFIFRDFENSKITPEPAERSAPETHASEVDRIVSGRPSGGKQPVGKQPFGRAGRRPFGRWRAGQRTGEARTAVSRSRISDDRMTATASFPLAGIADRPPRGGRCPGRKRRAFRHRLGCRQLGHCGCIFRVTLPAVEIAHGSPPSDEVHSHLQAEFPRSTRSCRRNRRRCPWTSRPAARSAGEEGRHAGPGDAPQGRPAP